MVRKGSKLFGVSTQTDSAIRIWHSLYTLPEVIRPISGVHLSHNFRYFYSWSGGGSNSLESQLTLTVLLGFCIPYIPYQKLWCLFLVCTSLTLIRYFYSWSGGGPNSLEYQLTLTVLLRFCIPYIPCQILLCLFLVCTSLTLSGISTLGQEGVQTLWSLSSH